MSSAGHYIPKKKQQLRHSSRPIVTQEFVKKWTKYFAEYPSQHRLEEILQWSGVEVLDE